MSTEAVTYGIGGYLPDHPSGNVVERLVDHGDGTGTRTTYAADGSPTVTDVTGLPVAPPPLPIQALAASDPEATSRAVAAGALLVERAGALWDALLEVAPTNTAKPLLDQIVDVALTAALDQPR